MSDSEAIDLSPLDPERDPERWARFVSVTRLRVEAAMENLVGIPAPLELVGAWFRPILAAAAVVMALLGSARLLVGGRTGPLEHASEARRLAALSEDSFERGLRPTGSQLLVALRSRSAP